MFVVKDLWLSFGEVHLFRGLNFTIQRYEAFAVLGPGGTGKSTLLKLLAGLDVPTRGRIEFSGVSWQEIRRHETASFRKRLSMTFQQGGLFDFLKCYENLDFVLREVTSLSSVERKRKIAQALDEVGLTGAEGLMVHEMSGGMQHRLGIARALITSPEVVLFDDPTAGLDPITSRAILDLILGMKRKYRMTIVLVTSDPTQAIGISDRVGILCDGTFVTISASADISQSRDPLVRQFLFGLREGPLTTRLRQ